MMHHPLQRAKLLMLATKPGVQAGGTFTPCLNVLDGAILHTFLTLGSNLHVIVGQYNGRNHQ